MSKVIVVIAAGSLFLAYATYAVTLFPVISQSARWYVFGFHMSLIILTLFAAIIGVLRGSRVCLLALIAILPLVYLQFFS
jgi:hypothetical protein